MKGFKCYKTRKIEEEIDKLEKLKTSGYLGICNSEFPGDCEFERRFYDEWQFDLKKLIDNKLEKLKAEYEKL